MGHVPLSYMVFVIFAYYCIKTKHMGHVTIRHMVFVIVTYYIYLDITDGTCYF